MVAVCLGPLVGSSRSPIQRLSGSHLDRSSDACVPAGVWWTEWLWRRERRADFCRRGWAYYYDVTSYGTQANIGNRVVERLLTVRETCRLQGRRLQGHLATAITGDLHGTRSHRCSRHHPDRNP